MRGTSRQVVETRVKRDKETMRLLIVDDNAADRAVLSELGTAWGYECFIADSHEIAAEMFRTTHFDVVVSEWKSSTIDAPSLCRRLRAEERYGYTYFIICSERRDTKSVVEGLDAGADDYVGKPFDSAELRSRIEAGLRLLNLDRSPMSAKSRLERGLAQAALTLKSMLPQPKDDKNLRTDWLFRPCAIVGGDLFNVVDLDDNHVCLYAIDVSGHEVGAALFAVTLGHMLLPRRQVDEAVGGNRRTRYTWNQNPTQVASTLNDRFQMEPPMNMYATLFYAVINRKDLTLKWVRAGHPSPIIVRNGQKIVLEEGDFAIGMFENCGYTEHTVQLQSGDRLFIYSDGIVEAVDPRTDEMLGKDHLESMLIDLSGRPFKEMIHAIDDALLAHRNGDGFEDDLSLLAVEIK